MKGCYWSFFFQRYNVTIVALCSPTHQWKPLTDLNIEAFLCRQYHTEKKQQKFLAEVETHTSGDVATVNGVIML